MFWNHRLGERRIVGDRRCVEVHRYLLCRLVQSVLRRLILASGARHRPKQRGGGAAGGVLLGVEATDQCCSLLDLDGGLELNE